MNNFQKNRPRPQPLTKDQLREMLAQAVRNTQPKRSPHRRPARIAPRVDRCVWSRWPAVCSPAECAALYGLPPRSAQSFAKTAP